VILISFDVRSSYDFFFFLLVKTFVRLYFVMVFVS